MLSLPSFNRKCRVGQGVKTPPFHGGITGSNPVRGTDLKLKPLIEITIRGFCFFEDAVDFMSVIATKLLKVNIF